MSIKSTELYANKAIIEGYSKDRHATYRYMLLEGEKEIEFCDRKVKLPCYGIEIIREDMNGGELYSVERDRIECMTTYKYKVVQLIKKLADNCVSPIHLVEIAGEKADEWTCDFDAELNSIAAQ